MPGFLMHVGAGMQCPHGGMATIAPSQTRVVVSGQPIATMSSVMSVAGCVFTVPGPKPQPCVLVKWAMPSTRFVVSGQPVALIAAPGAGPAIAQSADQIPAGPPIVSAVQARVIGS
jgi:hypothetical protein